MSVWAGVVGCSVAEVRLLFGTKMPGAFPTHLSSHHACKVPCLAHMKSANRQKHAGSCWVPSCKLERKRHGIWSRDCGMCPMKQWRVNCSSEDE